MNANNSKYVERVVLIKYIHEQDDHNFIQGLYWVTSLFWYF